MRKRQKKKNLKKGISKGLQDYSNFLSLPWKRAVIEEFYKDIVTEYTPIFGEES